MLAGYTEYAPLRRSYPSPRFLGSASTSSAIGYLLNILPSIVCWEIWKARNLQFFDGVVLPAFQVYRPILAEVHAISITWPLAHKTTADVKLLSMGVVPFLKPRVPSKVTTLNW